MSDEPDDAYASFPTASQPPITYATPDVPAPEGASFSGAYSLHTGDYCEWRPAGDPLTYRQRLVNGCWVRV